MREHPNNIVRAMRKVGYSFDDMLQAYPGKDNVYLDVLLRDCSLALRRPIISYGLLGIHPCQSSYFNITRHGFRSNGKNQPWPPDKERINIFFFGGSTAVGFNIEDSQTIPAVLGRKLNNTQKRKKIEIYNFASGAYTCRHEFLRLLDLLDNDIFFDYAIFLDGYNECFYALGNKELVYALDYLYQQEKRRRGRPYIMALVDSAITSFQLRTKLLPTAQNYEPEFCHERIKQYLSDDNIKRILEQSDKELSIKEIDTFFINLAQKVWENYLLSSKMIRTVCSQKGVRPIFVWQPIPFFKTDKKQRIMERLFFVFRYGAFGYFIYNWLNHSGYPYMQNTADFINLCRLGQGLDKILYIDICHYSPFFCEVIADAIATRIQKLIWPY